MPATERRKVGYLVPEFPGQTHLFLWRELQGLAEAGIDCKLIATRRPPDGIISHSWAEAAIERTTYLSPATAKDIFAFLAEMLRGGPMRLARCISVILGKSDLSAKGRLRLLMLLVPASKLVRVARTERLDHVHVQSCADAANVAMLASLISNLTYSLSLLGPTLEGYGPNQRNKWRFASFAVVMSDLLYQVVRNRLSGSLPPQVSVLPVGVDLEVMRRGKSYEPWHGVIPCGIYSCGRLNQVKGHRDLIEAVSIMRARGIPVQLNIAGEDELGGRGYRCELERYISEVGADNYVKLLGAIDEEQHRAWLETSHVFALASLNEGISVAIMEAMAMQIPVVVTNVGGNSELIEHGETGIFTEPENPALFAAALELVLRDPDLAMRLSNQSRRKVREKFDSRASAATLAQNLFAVTSRVRQKTSFSSGGFRSEGAR